MLSQFQSCDLQACRWSPSPCHQSHQIHCGPRAKNIILAVVPPCAVVPSRSKKTRGTCPILAVAILCLFFGHSIYTRRSHWTIRMNGIMVLSQSWGTLKFKDFVRGSIVHEDFGNRWWWSREEEGRRLTSKNKLALSKEHHHEAKKHLDEIDMISLAMEAMALEQVWYIFSLLFFIPTTLSSVVNLFLLFNFLSDEGTRHSLCFVAFLRQKWISFSFFSLTVLLNIDYDLRYEELKVFDIDENKGEELSSKTIQGCPMRSWREVSKWIETSKLPSDAALIGTGEWQFFSSNNLFHARDEPLETKQQQNRQSAPPSQR